MKNREYLKEKADGMVALSEGESIVKTYHCITVNNGENEGYFTVTDRRVVLIEVSSRNRDCRKTEMPLDAVGGIDYQYRPASNTGKLIAAVLFFVACVACAVIPFAVAFPQVWVRYVLWGGAGLFFALGVLLACLRSTSLFVIRIYAHYPMTEFMGFSSTAKVREERFLIKPAADCQVMLREFGALILDIRQFGASVREKYFSKVQQRDLDARRKDEQRREAEEQDIARERELRAEEKARRRRLREQRRLEKESARKAAQKKKTDQTTEKPNFFDILNK